MLTYSSVHFCSDAQRVSRCGLLLRRLLVVYKVTRGSFTYSVFFAITRRVFALWTDLANHSFHLYFASCSAGYSFQFVLKASIGGGVIGTSLKGANAVDVCRRQLYAYV